MRLKHFISSSVLVSCSTFGLLPNAMAHNHNYGHYGVNNKPHYQHNNDHHQRNKHQSNNKHHQRDNRSANNEHHHNRDCQHDVVVQRTQRPQWRINIDYQNIGAWRSSYSY